MYDSVNGEGKRERETKSERKPVNGKIKELLSQEKI